jgi:hypothetical protein
VSPQIQDLKGRTDQRKPARGARPGDAVDSFVEIGGFAIFVQYSWRIHNLNMAIYQRTGLHSVSRPRFECREGSMNSLVVTGRLERVFLQAQEQAPRNGTTAFQAYTIAE